MDRRHYLHGLSAAATLALAGCSSGDDGPDDRSPTPTATSTSTDTNADDGVTAGDATVRLSAPRIRPSVRVAGTHVDVHAIPGRQFLVLDAATDRRALETLNLSVVADGATVAEGFRFVGRPDSERTATVAFPVPVAEYGSAAVVLDAGNERDRWPVPVAARETLGRAPAFRVEGPDVPASVTHGDAFDASFTVANEGDRDARFLAAFGHGLVSDTGEVTRRVPAGERRTHEVRVDPPYRSESDTVPVVLDWGLDRRRVQVPVESAPLSADDALVIRSQHPVEGTMVNLGAGGIAENVADRALVDCVVEATGDGGEKTYAARATRARLDPGAQWEWSVAFGEAADASHDDAVENLHTITRASYAQ